jgi:CRP-like cAMP-binding protein
VTDDVLAALQATELFRDLPAKRVRMIREAGRELHYPAGSELVVEGEEAGRFFLVLDGTVEVTVRGTKRASLGPGGAVGELALIDGGTRSATVTASTDVHTFSLASWNFRPFLSEPDVLQAVVAVLCRRLREAEAALSQSTTG